MTRDTKSTVASRNLKEVTAVHKANPAEIMPKPVVATSRKVKPAELAQDAGGGYNPDGTFPQQ